MHYVNLPLSLRATLPLRCVDVSVSRRIFTTTIASWVAQSVTCGHCNAEITGLRVRIRASRLAKGSERYCLGSALSPPLTSHN